MPLEAVSSGASPRDEASVPKAQKVDWRVVWAAAAAMLVEGYDLGVYGNLLPFLLKDGTLGMDTALAGVAGSAVFIGMLLGGLAAGWLNSRYGQRKVLVCGISVFSATMLCTASVHDSVLFTGTRLLAGAGLGVVMPVCMAMARSACSSSMSSLCISVVMGGIPAGGIAASLLSWLTASHVGWRPLFVVGALIGPVLIPLLFSVLRRIVDPEREATDREVAQDVSPGSRRGVPLRELLAPAIAGMAATFCFLLSFYGLMTWLTKLMTEIRVPLDGALQLTLVLNTGAVLGSLLTGLLATRFGTLTLTVVSGVIGAVCLVLLPSGVITGAAMMLVVAVLGMVSPSAQNLVNTLVSEAVAAHWRTGVLGFTLGVGRLGAVLAPVIGSYLLVNVPAGEGITSPAGAVFVAFAVASLGSVVAACWLGGLGRRRTRHDQSVSGL